MAKTVFQAGTVVTADFLNTIFGADATHGHVHDGANSDGHCPKNALAEVDFASGIGTLDGRELIFSPAYGTPSSRIGKIQKFGNGLVLLAYRTAFEISGGAVNYLKLTLPTGFQPGGFYIYQNALAKVFCVQVTEGPVYTEIGGLCCVPFRESGVDYLYIAGKGLHNSVPSTPFFTDTNSYIINVQLLYWAA